MQLLISKRQVNLLKEYFDPIYLLKKKFGEKEYEYTNTDGERYREEIEDIVKLIFKLTIKEHPVDKLKGLRVVSIYPQNVYNDTVARWNIEMKPITPDWFNYLKNEKFLENLKDFEKSFRKMAAKTGFLRSSPTQKEMSGRFNRKNPEEWGHELNFHIALKTWESF